MKILKSAVFIFSLALFGIRFSFADTWTQKASITGIRDGVVSFSISNKGYVGTGYNSGVFTFYHDFWEWDPATNVWTQKADFVGGDRAYAVGFSIGEKGYLGTGFAPNFKKDFWEWDSATNTWTQRADFGGAARWLATGFSIGMKGYIGTGSIAGGPENSVQDFWEWDGDTTSVTYDTWIQKDSFPGVPRSNAVGFSIGAYGYMGLGTDAFYRYGDFWEWDQATDTWSQKTDFGGTARQEAAGFSIGTKGYIGTGDDGLNKKDFWEWDQATNLWTQKADFGGAPRRIATGFSIGNRGYIGMGFFFTVSTNDFWEYCDTCSGTGITDLNNFTDVSVFPNPASDILKISLNKNHNHFKLEIYNTIGTKVFIKEYVNANSVVVDVSSFAKGIYFFKLSDENRMKTIKVLVE